MGPPWLSEWFERREGRAIPAAVELLLLAKSSRVPRLKAAKIIVVTVPSAEVLEGLRQLPMTRSFLGEVLGPTSVVVAENQLAALQSVLEDLGITLEFEPLAAGQPHSQGFVISLGTNHELSRLTTITTAETVASMKAFRGCSATGRQTGPTRRYNQRARAKAFETGRESDDDDELSDLDLRPARARNGRRHTRPEDRQGVGRGPEFMKKSVVG